MCDGSLANCKLREGKTSEMDCCRHFKVFTFIAHSQVCWRERRGIQGEAETKLAS